MLRMIYIYIKHMKMFQRLQPPVVELAVLQGSENWSHPISFHRSRKAHKNNNYNKTDGPLPTTRKQTAHNLQKTGSSCFVVRGCGVSRRYIDVCYCDMFSVVNVYLDHLKFYVVCINSRRYVCCSECDVVSNECNEPTSCLVQPIGAH